MLRTEGVDQCVAQAAVVQITGGGERLVLLEQRFGTLEREQARRAGTQVTFQPSSKIASDRPVRAGFAGRRHGATYMADAALGVGHRAFLLAPARGRQQKVGVAAGLGGEEGFLHHDEGAGGQGLMDFLLVRQRLRRVGTGDPQRLDLACTHRLEQPNGGQSRLFGQLLDTPVGRHFCTVFGIGRVAVAGQQVGQAAGFAAAHGVRLTGE